MMDFASNYADIVDFEFIQEVCPEAAIHFLQVLVERQISLETFAKCFRWEEPDYEELLVDQDPGEQDDEVFGKELLEYIYHQYHLLQQAFSKATTVDDSYLELHVGYHEEDIGSRYDDVTGVYWSISGAYQLASAGQKFKDKFERKFYVTQC